MEAKKRKPLSNCTNTITTRNSNSSNPATSQLKSPNLSKSTLDDVFPEKHIEFNTSVRSNTPKSQHKSPNSSKSTFDDVFPEKLIEIHTGDGSIGSNPSPSPAVPVTPPLRIPNPSSTDSGGLLQVSGKPLIEYTRRQSADKTKAKGKMVVPPLSCPPAKRIRYFRGEVGDAVLSKSCEIPRKRMELQIMNTPSTFKMPEKYKKLSTSPNVESDSSIGLNGMNPMASPLVPSTPLLHKPIHSSSDSGSSNPLIEYTRRASDDKRKENGKMVTAPSSCPPAERNTYFRDDVVDAQVSKSCIIPCKKKHRESQLDKDYHAYFEQQRAYFAEIDAFELAEEIGCESD